ncbi:MAG TPA: glycerol-3-phosphate 1-O-acyltransferase PlsY [Vicinamibacteria bacterium]|nr:glycerol-3-phosphate 1-O-acyltransferase PlsY [Vicinamibacteria bacterium]
MPDFSLSIPVFTAAYLLGSIPFSFLVARRHGVDVRTAGSGNVGATNVMRTAGRAAGLLAFLLDSGKGVLAVLATRTLGEGVSLEALAAVAAILGHLYPIWLGGRGGKGVATGAGTFLLLAPLPTVLSVLVFGSTLAIVRYVSISSLAGTAAMAALCFVLGSPRPVAWAAVLAAVLIAWKHRSNLQRIRQGTENRLGSRRPTED